MHSPTVFLTASLALLSSLGPVGTFAAAAPRGGVSLRDSLPEIIRRQLGGLGGGLGGAVSSLTAALGGGQSTSITSSTAVPPPPTNTGKSRKRPKQTTTSPETTFTVPPAPESSSKTGKHPLAHLLSPLSSVAPGLPTVLPAPASSTSDSPAKSKGSKKHSKDSSQGPLKSLGSEVTQKIPKLGGHSTTAEPSADVTQAPETTTTQGPAHSFLSKLLGGGAKSKSKDATTNTGSGSQGIVKSLASHVTAALPVPLPDATSAGKQSKGKGGNGSSGHHLLKSGLSPLETLVSGAVSDLTSNLPAKVTKTGADRSKGPLQTLVSGAVSDLSSLIPDVIPTGTPKNGHKGKQPLKSIAHGVSGLVSSLLSDVTGAPTILPTAVPAGSILTSVESDLIPKPTKTGSSKGPLGPLASSLLSDLSSVLPLPTDPAGTVKPFLSAVTSILPNPSNLLPTGVLDPTGLLPTGVLPNPTSILHHGTGLLPDPTGLLPTGVLPNPSGILPTGVVPNPTGILHHPSGILPTGILPTGVVPNPTGILHHPSGGLPNPTGILPTGVLPNPTGILPTGVLPNPTGTVPTNPLPSDSAKTRNPQSTMDTTAPGIPSSQTGSAAVTEGPSATGTNTDASSTGSVSAALAGSKGSSRTGTTGTAGTTGTTDTAGTTGTAGKAGTTGTSGSSGASGTAGSETTGTKSVEGATASDAVASKAEISQGPVFSIKPTGTNTGTTQSIGTSIQMQPSPTKGGVETDTNTVPAHFPSSMPQIIQPPGGTVKAPPNATLIQVGFQYPLNYPFVANTPGSARQIFHYLPIGIAWGLQLDKDQVRMHSLQPYNTIKDLGYVTTLALAYIPNGMVDTMQLDLHTAVSRMYRNPDGPTASLMSVINPGIALLAGTFVGDNGAYGPGGQTQIPGAGQPGGGDPMGSNGRKKKIQGTSVGIGVGVVSGAAVYGAAMFYVARRYKRRKLRHLRISSMTDGSPHSSGHYGSMMGAGALMSGGRSDFGYGYDTFDARNSRGSEQSSNERSVRDAGISGPLMAENSLGWH